jgi:hypothetical protein
MLTNHRFQRLIIPSATLRGLLLLSALAVSATSVSGQFSSGSTGADGALNPSSSLTITLPASGVLNYTTINIPLNVLVRFTRNSSNTPVTILAQGNVTISGQIIVSGDDNNGRLGGLGGPGGGRGGTGGTYIDSPFGTAGDGPGGGMGGTSITANGSGGGGGGGFFQSGFAGRALNGGTPGQGGGRYGTKILLPLIGGSGGGGAGINAGSQNIGAGGGGSGGAVLLASSTSIVFGTGTGSTPAGVLATGGSGDFDGLAILEGGGGSGGAIRLVSNTISGSPCLNVDGGNGEFIGGSVGDGGSGLVRVEAFNLSGLSVQCSTSATTLGQPNPVTLGNSPTLRIDSVGGVSAPANPVGLINAPPDIVVPTSVPNPVQVVVKGTNLPSGTAIQVQLMPETGTVTAVSGTLTGSTASSTTTVNLSLPASGVSVIRGMVTLDVLIALGKPTFVNGEKVEKVEVAATFGGASEVAYITSSGRRVRMAELQK